jgi:hypothetical protein
MAPWCACHEYSIHQNLVRAGIATGHCLPTWASVVSKRHVINCVPPLYIFHPLPAQRPSFLPPNSRSSKKSAYRTRQTNTMFKKANKSHVFNTRKQKVIKNARPLKAGKSFMSMESLEALLGEIPDSDTTRTVSGYYAPDLRAKITSASVTVLAPDSPGSCNKSHTSDTTSPSKVNIGYSSSATESSSEVMLQAKPVPRSKTVPDIFSRPILPPAFLPSYTNERSIVSIEPIIEAQVPAYARPSMSLWYRSAANSATQGTPFGLPPAGTALRRLNGGRGNLALHHTSPRRSRSSPNALARVSNLSMTAENDDVVREQPVVGVVQAGVITTTTRPLALSSTSQIPRNLRTFQLRPCQILMSTARSSYGLSLSPSYPSTPTSPRAKMRRKVIWQQCR